MQVTHLIATLVVVFLMNWGINTFYNKDRKDKDGDSISMATTAIQSLMSAVFALFILFIVFTYVLKTPTEST